MIVIVDYGMGNLRSVQKGFERIGSRAVIARDPEEIRKADALVLPGVGAFPECMKNLSRLNLVEPILEFIKSRRPFLGICLGLQLLFDESEEFGLHEGLKVIRGAVKEFNRNMDLKIPHMGWNQVFFRKDVPIFRGIPDGCHFYFVHSYYVLPDDERGRGRRNPVRNHIYLRGDPGQHLRGSVSSREEPRNGLKILANFAKL